MKAKFIILLLSTTLLFSNSIFSQIPVPTGFAPIGEGKPYDGNLYHLKGNFGLGTSTPGYRLDVNGDINITNNLKKNGSNISLWYGIGGNTVKTNGNIGIGTNAPTSKLEVIQNSSTDWASYIYNSHGSGKGLKIKAGYYSNNVPILQLEDVESQVRFKVLSNGYVGIGTANPTGRLHVKSVNAHYNGIPTLLVQDDGNRGTLVLESLDDNPTDFVFKSNGEKRVWLTSRNDADDNDFRIYTAPNGSPISRMSIEQNGYVGIGTTNPVERFQIGNKWTFHDGGVKIIGYNYDYVGAGDSRCIEDGNVSYMTFEEAGITFRFVEDAVTGVPFSKTTAAKIDINGIETIEIEVKPTVWPDYVFEEGYDLPSLTVVESFIQTHKHLPEIPSEKEIIENGLKLGEMNALLLQKIEELTLYTIEQQKKIDDLNSRINKIEKE